MPKAVRKRLAVEASIAGFWERYVGLDGKVIGMTSFGESAPANVLFDKIVIGKKDGVEVPRSFNDYEITVDKNMPEGVELQEKA